MEILDGYDLDQLVSFRIEPTGSAKLEAVGGRVLKLMKKISFRRFRLAKADCYMNRVNYHTKPDKQKFIDAVD